MQCTEIISKMYTLLAGETSHILPLTLPLKRCHDNAMMYSIVLAFIGRKKLLCTPTNNVIVRNLRRAGLHSK